MTREERDRLAETMMGKVPAYNTFWTDEMKAAWWRAFDAALTFAQSIGAAALAVVPPEPQEPMPDMLMLAIAQYEADEPHWQADRQGDEWYAPGITLATMREWLASPHDGDCTGQPQTCVRCEAEHYQHKARWLRARLRAEPAAREGEAWRPGVPEAGRWVAVLLKTGNIAAGKLMPNGFSHIGGDVNPYQITHWLRLPPAPTQREEATDVETDALLDRALEAQAQPETPEQATARRERLGHDIVVPAPEATGADAGETMARVREVLEGLVAGTNATDAAALDTWAEVIVGMVRHGT